MAQVTDRNIGANPTGFDMRTELNNIIGALESDNSGSSDPLNTVPYMKWLDTSNATYYYYKERNHDNTAWVTLFRYTVATKIMEAVSNGVVLQDSNIVHKTGDETIAGVKTFSSSPIVPTPIAGTQAANKQYADLKVALAAFTGTNVSYSYNGYQKLPSGLIIQWGSSASTTNGYGGSGVTYNIAFPTASFQPIICNGDNNTALHNVSVIESQVSNTGFGWVSDLPNTMQRLNWISIGY